MGTESVLSVENLLLIVAILAVAGAVGYVIIEWLKSDD